jgi:hypothetical protein
LCPRARNDESLLERCRPSLLAKLLHPCTREPHMPWGGVITQAGPVLARSVIRTAGDFRPGPKKGPKKRIGVNAASCPFFHSRARRCLAHVTFGTGGSWRVSVGHGWHCSSARAGPFVRLRSPGRLGGEQVSLASARYLSPQCLSERAFWIRIGKARALVKFVGALGEYSRSYPYVPGLVYLPYALPNLSQPAQAHLLQLAS